ncbi:MAG: hypothetical protein JXK05_09675 [Campylobacterales bacterium]|nr:hypothetical protein [Campylobacterales bacterium]
MSTIEIASVNDEYQLAYLTTSLRPDIRAAVAANPYTKTKTLYELSRDRDPAVRSAAKHSLSLRAEGQAA